jgi:hypothetical protein
LAGEYHWSKTEILDHVYIDEIEQYQKFITQRKIDGYMMELAIVHNPHVKNPKELFSQLKRSYPTDLKHIEEETLDKTSFANFTSMMQKSGGLEVKNEKKSDKR